MSAGAGRLVLVGTPIGNLEDLTPRAADALSTADVVACEDTRHTGTMLARSGISARRLMSLHEHNEASRIGEILELLAGGNTIALVSDAGMPTVSDPGARLVAATASAGYQVTVVPGPSAAVAALAVSGLASGRYAFEGFLARRGPARHERIAAIACSTCPTVVYEAPSRLAATLDDLATACGPERRVAVCRELTKLYEETWRGTLGEAAPRAAADRPRGEHVIVVDGGTGESPPARAEIEGELRNRIGSGIPRRQAVDEVAALFRTSRREVYELAIRLDARRGRGAARTDVPGESEAPG